MRILEHLAAGVIVTRIRAFLNENPDPAGAAALDSAAAGGLGGLVQWIATYGPELYAIARVIAALFGVPLPPLPPIPVPAAA